MAKKYEFGGDWTRKKLDRLRKYLKAYTTIFNSNPRARKLTTTYVDAFAGTGYWAHPQRLDDQTVLFEELGQQESLDFIKGSARIALEIEPPFQRYIFIERDSRRVAELEALKEEFPQKASAISIVQSDANIYLPNWCEETDWFKNRAVVFLDPYGMEVEWSTIEAIAKTQAIDLWLLFPLGVAVNRLLTRSSVPPEPWARRLDRMFGTTEWRTAFYSERVEATLMGPMMVTTKEADFRKIGEYFRIRLKSIFAGVAENPLPLRNSRGVPLYLLCFAAGNPKGAKTAVKIAQCILGK